eukprot:gene990-1321_t
MLCSHHFSWAANLWVVSGVAAGQQAEKWEMMLPALALEYISGHTADFVLSNQRYYRSKNAITAVKVRLSGAAAMDMLQKITYLVLPTQNAFKGINVTSVDRAGNIHFRSVLPLFIVMM